MTKMAKQMTKHLTKTSQKNVKKTATTTTTKEKKGEEKKEWVKGEEEPTKTKMRPSSLYIILHNSNSVISDFQFP